ncbi:MAG: ABC transporter ATP-binding protein [Chloroflexota bacterium]|jgi:branched-chain amino acid transport system ATP-binding protein
MLLDINDLEVYYGNIRALAGISFQVDEGEIVTLIGANGAGKSTTLRTISGLIPARSGSVTFQGKNLLACPPHEIVDMGVAHVPEGRGIFGNLTVLENLRLATYSVKDREEIRRRFKRVFGLFPRLEERKGQLGATLSGGEQQMLAVARALMTGGKLMLLDEPSMGLSPILVREIFRTIQEINQAGTTILLVEQNARMALWVANRAYVLETGRITLSGKPEEMAKNPEVRKAYLGG